MKLIYKGKFDGNVEMIPHGEHMPEAVKFKEAENPKQLAKIANVVAIVLTVFAFVGLLWRGGFEAYNLLGVLCSFVCLLPHEILHAICFKKEVYLYTYWNKGMLFVTGPETMTKGRFIFMSLFPNLVFGFIPYIMFFINPSWGFLGTLGAVSIGAGAGDYYNVFHALTQMPKGSRTYLYQFNSYWYMPEDEEKNEVKRGRNL